MVPIFVYWDGSLIFGSEFQDPENLLISLTIDEVVSDNTELCISDDPILFFFVQTVEDDDFELCLLFALFSFGAFLLTRVNMDL